MKHDFTPHTILMPDPIQTTESEGRSYEKKRLSRKDIRN